MTRLIDLFTGLIIHKQPIFLVAISCRNKSAAGQSNYAIKPAGVYADMWSAGIWQHGLSSNSVFSRFRRRRSRDIAFSYRKLSSSVVIRANTSGVAIVSTLRERPAIRSSTTDCIDGWGQRTSNVDWPTVRCSKRHWMPTSQRDTQRNQWGLCARQCAICEAN